MNFKQSFKRTVNLGILRKKHAEVPDGLMKRCKVCKTAVFVEEARQNQDICPSCGNYFRMHARHRIEQVLDEGSFEEWDTDLEEKNPMGYRGYLEKLSGLREKQDWMRLCSQERDGSTESLQPSASVTAVFSWQAWEKWWEKKITRAVERATKDRLPVIFFVCSGGARMQEGMTSLMQMAKTSAAIRRHSDAGLLYISVLTNPTTGGVTASFAMLGDIILAEPGALIGFAGPV
ncbi:MAG: acetyl-CoA carboxylase carboxyltransferase subunit beta [Blautia sp.]